MPVYITKTIPNSRIARSSHGPVAHLFIRTCASFLDMQIFVRELSQLATLSRSIRKHTTTRARCTITSRRSTSIIREAHTSCTQTRTSLAGCSRPPSHSTRQEWITKVVDCTSTTDSPKQRSRLKCISASTLTISNTSDVYAFFSLHVVSVATIVPCRAHRLLSSTLKDTRLYVLI